MGMDSWLVMYGRLVFAMGFAQAGVRGAGDLDHELWAAIRRQCSTSSAGCRGWRSLSSSRGAVTP
eukprot:5383965-Prymnesium_polylepis.1